MTEKEAVEKIKKLLRMKRGGTQEEIDTALRIAQELANKHRVDIGSVNADEEILDEKLTHEDIMRAARIQWECQYAALVCRNFFNVNILRYALHEKRIAFIGTQKDIDIARYVYMFLVRQFRHAWKTRRGNCRDRQSFLFGMFKAIEHNLELRKRNIEKENGSSIILIGNAIELRNAYVQNVFGKTKSFKCSPEKENKAATYGWLAGLDTQINDALKAPISATKLITGN